MNLQPTVLETVALPVRATGLQSLARLFSNISRGSLLDLPMENMLAAKWTVLFELQPIGMLLLILGATVIEAVTIAALELDRFVHDLGFFIDDINLFLLDFPSGSKAPDRN